MMSSGSTKRDREGFSPARVLDNGDRGSRATTTATNDMSTTTTTNGISSTDDSPTQLGYTKPTREDATLHPSSAARSSRTPPSSSPARAPALLPAENNNNTDDDLTQLTRPIEVADAEATPVWMRKVRMLYCDPKVLVSSGPDVGVFSTTMMEPRRKRATAVRTVVEVTPQHIKELESLLEQGIGLEEDDGVESEKGKKGGASNRKGRKSVASAIPSNTTPKEIDWIALLEAGDLIRDLEPASLRDAALRWQKRRQKR
eukprot:PhM_4_TR13375/c0_g1_i1/m.11012